MAYILAKSLQQMAISSTPTWASIYFSPQRLLSLNPQLSNYSIGKFSYGTPAPTVFADAWNPQATLRIGKFCSIAQDVNILLGTEHRKDWVTTYPFPWILDEFGEIKGYRATKGSVTIGNDVWIGMDVLILDGVSIADGAVIGAGSVVTKNVEPYAIVGGNPARIIGKRFDQGTIDKLLKIKWWDWSMERIRENMHLLMSNRIEEFIKKNYVAE